MELVFIRQIHGPHQQTLFVTIISCFSQAALCSCIWYSETRQDTFLKAWQTGQGDSLLNKAGLVWEMVSETIRILPICMTTCTLNTFRFDPLKSWINCSDKDFFCVFDCHGSYISTSPCRACIRFGGLVSVIHSHAFDCCFKSVCMSQKNKKICVDGKNQQKADTGLLEVWVRALIRRGGWFRASA